MESRIFKAYDIRGIYPSEINVDVATKVAETCANMFKPGTIVVAHDVRHGSTELAQAVEKTLTKKFKVEFIGLATTPMFYFLVNHLKASGGVMITASHNPKEYNGMKIVTEGAILVSGIEIKKMMK